MNNELPPDVQRQLRDLLARLPNVPVASNFTVRVMNAVELEEMRRSRWHFGDWNWRVFFPRATATAVVVGFAVFTFHQYEVSSQRHALAENVAFVAGSQPMPSVDALKNFDAIQRMGQSARPDDELLALAPNMK